ncbi:hypothetical protein [Shimia ponticola]|uniref:hypothetical protein n=1 Tax=Shimia ponticola TaxID=2582893 RepID=UPI0011BE688F|nr:hypothetical protein [Shimia ponticola]
MAELPAPELRFDDGCPDCGSRAAVLPLPLPRIDDDFDWKARDYDSFRLFMMQELASRFPERRRWTSADMEVVIVEVLAAALDRASHALDRVQAERFIDTARRPESVRRLLKLIGWEVDAGTQRSLEKEALARAMADGTSESEARANLPPMGALIEDYWRANPAQMEAARRNAPRRITEQNRMVTVQDHATVMESHPLVALAQARLQWTGSWHSIMIAALLFGDVGLDKSLHDAESDSAHPSALSPELWADIQDFHAARGLDLPPVNAGLTGRRILRGMIEQYRMIGSEVFLETARAASVSIVLSVRAKPGYFRSELRHALEQVFTADQGGFFEPGRLRFGEGLYASDIIEAAMQVEGVAVACLNLFKRVGSAFPDQTSEGVIPVEADEFIRCQNAPRNPAQGTIRITVNGGEVG